jgi:hypothetical protein
MLALVERISAVHAALDGVDIPHAFGGALALAFAVEQPRGTVDIDVNVFVDPSRARTVFEALPAGVDWSEDDLAAIRRDGQVRVWWERTPLDLFFNTAPFHENTARNARRVPFAGGEIPVLHPNDLAVFKAFFDRPKDWVDLESMAAVSSFDVATVRRWLVELLGADDHRLVVLDEVLARAAQPPRPLPRL